jgi:hypothetical protein
MSLFTRLLTSLYPEQLLNQPGSPAGLFLGMISPQSFFNVVTKKMAENYKINRFDVALDPFEVKIGFGEQSMIKPKAMQSYYSYCAAANLNGYQLYTIGSIATNMTIMASQYLRPLVNYPKQHRYLTHLLFSLYVTAHVFATGLKQFPEEDSNASYQWFLDIWFNYYQLILDHNTKQQPIDPAIVQQIKTRVVGQIELCFGLYRMMKYINQLLTWSLDRTYLKRLCDHEVTKQINSSQSELIDHIINRCHDASLDGIDYELMQVILPHDFNVKYFFWQQDVYHTVDYIVGEIYDRKRIDQYLTQCLDDNSTMAEFIAYICDHHHIKDHFFAGVRDLVTKEIRDEDVDEEEMEEFVSMIGWGMIWHIPESLRRESIVTERLMNFYLNYMGSLWWARGDTFALMLDRRLASKIQNTKHDSHPNAYELDLYRHYLTQYSVNTSYYHYVYEWVRSGKASFTLPYIVDSDEVYANMPMIDLLIQSSLACIMQDTLHKEIKLYPQSKGMIREFKKLYGDRIATHIKSDPAILMSYVMPALDQSYYDLVASETTIAHMREALYTIDLHCYHDVLSQLIVHEIYVSKYHTHSTILIAATLRETLYGVLCMMALLEQQTKYSRTKSEAMIQFLLTSYVIHVLWLQDTATMIICFDIIYVVYKQVADLLDDVVKLDDNEEFLMMGAEFMNRFLKDKDDPVKAHLALLNEDVVRLRWYLKHINYYNKRYFIPQS